MSSPRTETTARTDEPEKPKSSGLSPVQVAASALAAVSSAVLLSFFGVAGTLIGAGLASVISTVGASLYGTSLKKTNERLRRVMSTKQQAAAKAAVATSDPAATREMVAASAEAAAPTRTLPAALDPRRAPAKRFSPPWGRIAVYAVGVFVVAMGIITGIELIGQKPVSALVTNTSTTGGTTIGDLTNASSSKDTTPSTPSSPTSTAPATTTPTESSPAEPTGDEEQQTQSSSSSSTSSSSQSTSSSTARSSAATPTGSSASSSAQGAAPTG